MWMKARGYRKSWIPVRLSDFCTTKPEFRWKEAQTRHPMPRFVHVIDGRPKIFYSAVFDGQCQKDCAMCREVFVELWQSLEEATPPCPAPAPFAEGAETPVAGISCPKDRLTLLRPLQWDLHANRRRAIADSAGDVQRLGVHCQVVAYGCVVPPVFAVRLQHARMRVGRGSNTAGLWRAMHLVSSWLDNHMLPSTFYRRNHRIP